MIFLLILCLHQLLLFQNNKLKDVMPKSSLRIRLIGTGKYTVRPVGRTFVVNKQAL